MSFNRFPKMNNWQLQGLAILRIITGLLMAYHGLEVFDPGKMTEYAKWEVLQTLPSPLLMVYFGKGIELVTGVLLTIGLLTRTVALIMAINMFVICFRVGTGKFYYEDQHPFLFGLLGLVFFFTGPVCWSLDQVIFKKARNAYTV
ncbi:MAG: DoxX family protein [Ferruginibacter sp.]|nr:DoxX family protein [Ferruginibacter sp.]